MTDEEMDIELKSISDEAGVILHQLSSNGMRINAEVRDLTLELLGRLRLLGIDNRQYGKLDIAANIDLLCDFLAAVIAHPF